MSDSKTMPELLREATEIGLTADDLLACYECSMTQIVAAEAAGDIAAARKAAADASRAWAIAYHAQLALPTPPTRRSV